MTRARRLLYITCNGEGPDWIIERLKSKLAGLQPGLTSE